MDWILENRLKKLIDYHESDTGTSPKKLTLELGDMHTDALQRICILEGLTKTAMIRHLIIQHVQALGPGAVIDDPALLYDLLR
jgi:hypothetical protein